MKKFVKVSIAVLKAICVLGIFALAWVASPWAGIFSIIFGLYGFLKGYNTKMLKEMKSCMDKVIEGKEDLIKGKTLQIFQNSETKTIDVKFIEEEEK